MGLGERMKGYEKVAATRLMQKMPVLLRLDGKAFHTLTRGMERPYDTQLMSCMQDAARYLCEQIQGAQLAYQQSDEISLLLVDYQRQETQSWFNYEVQKMCSVAASLCTAAFTMAFRAQFPGHQAMPAFDARCWNLPAHEVTNYFIWRQQDATRNSISMAAQTYYSPRQLHMVNSDVMQEMLHEKGINWNDYPVAFKRGVAICKVSYEAENAYGNRQPPTVLRSKWVLDENIPIFTQDRNYVERFVVGN